MIDVTGPRIRDLSRDKAFIVSSEALALSRLVPGCPNRTYLGSRWIAALGCSLWALLQLVALNCTF